MVGEIIRPLKYVMDLILPLLVWIYYWIIRLRIFFFNYSGLASGWKKEKLESGIHMIFKEMRAFSEPEGADSTAWPILAILLIVPDSRKILHRMPMAPLLSKMGIGYLQKARRIYILLGKHNRDQRAMWRACLAFVKSQLRKENASEGG